MNNVMLDLETMGTGAHAAIVAIGAVQFDKAGILREFYSTIDLKDSIEYGDVDASTVLWWMAQEKRARKEIYGATTTLDTVLRTFSEWMLPNSKVWGNGSDFDNVILTNAYMACHGTKQPWSYSANRCYRTTVAMHDKLNIERLGVHHNALDDATYQANYLIALGVL